MLIAGIFRGAESEGECHLEGMLERKILSKTIIPKNPERKFTV
jgi:hypothetical protein